MKQSRSMGSELGAADKLELLSRAAERLASSVDLETMMGHAVAACLPALGDFGFIDLRVEGDVIRTSRAHEDAPLEQLLRPRRWSRRFHPEIKLCALTVGEPCFNPECDDAWYQRIAVDAEHLALLRTLAFTSMISVPMRFQQELVGSLTLFFGRSRRHHTPEHLAFAQDLAQLAVPALVNGRLAEGHRRAQEALRASEQRLRLAMHAGNLGVWDWDIRADKVDWSDRLYDFHGIDEFGGTVSDFAKLIHPEDGARLKAALDRALVTGEDYQVDFRTTRPDGDVRWLATRAAVIRDEIGAPARMLGATIDVTERVRLLHDSERSRAEAEAARREAEAASRAKDEFLAILGHELRNPLAPIVAALDLLDLRGETAARRERDIIARQVDHLSRLVDDLLDVSRIARGKVELELRRVDLREIIEKALEMARPLFAPRELVLSTELGSGPTWVLGDPVRLAQVVGNLLTNAAKFTPAGGRIDVTLRGAELVIRDTGKGIARDLLPHVFDLFVQGPQALDRRDGGLGLGLAIVRNLVDLHGGTVTAESDGPGLGSTFRVRLPRADEDAPSRPPPPRGPRRRGSGRVLVVDDNTDAAELIGELLRGLGYEVALAATAIEALAHADEKPPALAILDIGLPGMDGYELATQLRARSPLRLIALTGYGREADRRRALDAGFEHHFVKPVPLRALLDVVTQLLQ